MLKWVPLRIFINQFACLYLQYHENSDSRILCSPSADIHFTNIYSSPKIKASVIFLALSFQKAQPSSGSYKRSESFNSQCHIQIIGTPHPSSVTRVIISPSEKLSPLLPDTDYCYRNGIWITSTIFMQIVNELSVLVQLKELIVHRIQF